MLGVDFREFIFQALECLSWLLRGACGRFSWLSAHLYTLRGYGDLNQHMSL